MCRGGLNQSKPREMEVFHYYGFYYDNYNIWNKLITNNFIIRVYLFFAIFSTISVSSFSFPSHTPITKADEEDAIPRSRIHGEEHAHEVHYSRERSRAAYKVIEEYLMPFVEREKYPISQYCKLHPDNDVFRDQEQHKIHVDINEWRCGYCKKSFRSEKYLDQHFDNRHSNLLNVKHQSCSLMDSSSPSRLGSVCILLALNLCGALHCDIMMDSKFHKRKCNPAAASRNQHLCESLATKCFPVLQGPSANQLHEFFLRQFCDAHTCSGGRKPFPRGSRKHTSIFYLAISILTLMLLPIFYAIVYLYQREMRKGYQGFKRISQKGLKPKPS